MTPAQRAAVVLEARSWLGTPYVHMGKIKGVGVDCAQLLILTYSNAGVVELFDPGTYTYDWFLHRSEEIYQGWLSKHCHKVDSPMVGDIAAYRIGRTVSHAGIITEPGYLIHAYRLHGKVDKAELRSLENKFDSFWRISK